MLLASLSPHCCEIMLFLTKKYPGSPFRGEKVFYRQLFFLFSVWLPICGSLLGTTSVIVLFVQASICGVVEVVSSSKTLETVAISISHSFRDIRP